MFSQDVAICSCMHAAPIIQFTDLSYIAMRRAPGALLYSLYTNLQNSSRNCACMHGHLHTHAPCACTRMRMGMYMPISAAYALTDNQLVNLSTSTNSVLRIKRDKVIFAKLLISYFNKFNLIFFHLLIIEYLDSLEFNNFTTKKMMGHTQQTQQTSKPSRQSDMHKTSIKIAWFQQEKSEKF